MFRSAVSLLASRRQRQFANKSLTLTRFVSHKSKGTSKSWVPTTQEELQEVTMQAMIHEVSLAQVASVTEVVPWFLKNMPVSAKVPIS